MANILPFNGIFYNPSLFADYEEVLAPPYDEISHEHLSALMARSPYNIVRVECARAQKNKYRAAKRFLDASMKNRILLRDERPSIVLYEQTFASFSGKTKTRTGFIAHLELEEFYKEHVFPHEQTFLAPKQDRLKLLETCGMHVSGIFGFYEDASKKTAEIFHRIKRTKPFVAFKDSSRLPHVLWKMQDDGILSELRRLMQTKKIFIADGHHRYETALWFYKRHPERRPRTVMCYFVAMEDKGLEVLPIHRLVKLKNFNFRAFSEKMSAYFAPQVFRSVSHVEEYLKTHSGAPAVGVCAGNRYMVFTLKNKSVLNAVFKEKHSPQWKSLSVNVLHHLILEKIFNFRESEKSPFISYVKQTKETSDVLKQDSALVLFVLPPIPPSMIKKLSLQKELMPRKSTFFYPKIPTGITLSEVF